MSNFDKKAFGERVRNRRRGVGLTQAQLADASSTSRTTLGIIERGCGDTSVRILAGLADALAVSPGYLLFGAERYPVSGGTVPCHEREPVVTLLERALEQLRA